MASPNTLKSLRAEGHAAFDPIWQARAAREGIPQNKARNEAYRWLAKELKLSTFDCHFSRMKPDKIRAAIALCKQYSLD